MNPPPPPPQPHIQPHRPSISSTTCDLHPNEQFTGFCPLCLCDRLSLLDTNNNINNSKSTTTNTTTSAAIKNLFKPSTTFPELRRTKSFSVSNREPTIFSGPFEPQRKSCDVKVRNNNNNNNNNPLWWLFNQPTNDPPRKSATKEKSSVVDEIEVVQHSNVASSSSTATNTATTTTTCVVDSVFQSKDDGFDEIRVSDDFVRNVVVEDDENPFVEEKKVAMTMKDHIDLDLHKRRNPSLDLKEIAGSFMSAASGFSKKLQIWSQKQKTKKDRKILPVEKSIGRQYRETQSEIADYGFGRKSCDTDPRFSLDARRMSFCDTEPRFSLDVGRMSFDEPRVSWDGHLMAKTNSRMAPMVAVVEDDVVQVHVPRTDSEIPVEQTSCLMDSDDGVPGGSAQTRDYYLDSSSKRRKSLDRSSSLRKTASVIAQSEEMIKPVSNARVSPDDCLETFKMGFRDNASIMGEVEKKEPSKKSSRWSKAFNIWGLIHRRGEVKGDDMDKFNKRNGVGLGRSFSHSWQDVQIEHSERNPKEDFSKIFRSNSSASWRNSNGFEGSTSFCSSSVRKNSIDMNVHDKKRKDEFVLERNRSARYSPNHVDNGLLKFYLNPLGGNWRSTSTGKNRPNHTHPIARSVLGLY